MAPRGSGLRTVRIRGSMVAELGDDRVRAVAGRAERDDELQRAGVVLGERVLDGLRDVALLVEDADDDADARSPGRAPSRGRAGAASGTSRGAAGIISGARVAAVSSVTGDTRGDDTGSNGVLVTVRGDAFRGSVGPQRREPPVVSARDRRTGSAA